MKTGQYQLTFLIALLFSLCLGIFCSAYFDISFSAALPYFLSVLLIGSGAAIFLIYRQSPKTWIVFVGLFFVLGMLRFAAVYDLPASDISNYAGQDAKVEGVVTEPPRITADPDGGVHLRYTAQVTSIFSKGEEHVGEGNILIYSRARAGDDLPEVHIGDHISAEGTVRRPHSYQNPGQIDTAFLLRSQGITARLHTSQDSLSFQRAEKYSLFQNIIQFAADVRTHYINRMSEVMPHSDAAAIFAMLFGGYEGIRPELLEAFTTTGIIHILSVSGSHISLIAAVTAWFSIILKFPKWARAISVIFVISAYVVLAGFVPPAVRSGIMGGIAFVGLVLGQERDAQRILIVTGILMLLVSPLLFFHISFQLSFLATAGLLFIAPILFQRMKGISVFAAGSLSITMSAQLATLPMLAWYFNQVSLSSLLSNFIVVPIVDIIIIVGLLGGITAWIIPLAGKVVFAFDSILLSISFELTRFMAALPASKIFVPTPEIGVGCAYYTLLLLIFAPQELRDHLIEFIKGKQKVIGVSLGVLLIFFIFRYIAQPPELSVHFIDVGQGDSVLLITPHGHAMMFDTGGTRDDAFDIGARVDVPYLLHYGVRELDYIFLSHAHADHAAGAHAILAKMPVKHVFIADEGVTEYARSMHMGDSDPLLLKFSKSEEGRRITVDGVTIDTVYAPPYDPSDSATGNEVSNVYRVHYGSASFLFTGDLVKEHEAKLLALHKDIQSTVLEVPHHGSNTSSSEEFIAAVHPVYAVYSVGRDNTFGHPKQEVADRYEKQGIKTLRTDYDGAIVFRTDGSRLKVETYTAHKILH